jgi:hypothetical protein
VPDTEERGRDGGGGTEVRHGKVDGQISPIADASTTQNAKYSEAIDDIVSSHFMSDRV